MSDGGYSALRESAAWLDLSRRGRLRATGEDRVRLLHALSSNHIQQLQTGQGCYAFFLNAQGRIQADAVIFAFGDALLIDTEPETRATLLAHIEKYIIADDVTVEDATDSTFELGLEGPRAEEVLRAAGARPPAEALWSWSAWGGWTVARTRRGFAIIGSGDPAATATALEAAGAVRATAESARAVRIELGQPRYGEDITDRNLPQETQQLDGVHFSKGCYLGQEIVERVRARGGVHRFLEAFEIDTSVVPAAGTKIVAGGREVGEITSAVFSPARGKVAALGYVRRNEVPSGAELKVN